MAFLKKNPEFTSQKNTVIQFFLVKKGAKNQNNASK